MCERDISRNHYAQYVSIFLLLLNNITQNFYNNEELERGKRVALSYPPENLKFFCVNSIYNDNEMYGSYTSYEPVRV